MNTNKNIITVIIVAALIVGIYVYFSYYERSYANVTTYKECVDAGYPIRETYPEQCQTPDRRLFTNPNQTVASSIVATTTEILTGKENLLRVNNPLPNQSISSPLIIEGIARGTWYFEASFPVELLDGNGKQLAIKPAQAKEDWMTTEFVPFSVVLTFTKPITSTGTLILHKDNPSGNPVFDDFLAIPLMFK